MTTKFLVRMEAGTADSAILEGNGGTTYKNRDTALKLLKEKLATHSRGIPVKFTDLFCASQSFIEPRDRSKFPHHTDDDVLMYIQSYAVAFDSDDSQLTGQILNDILHEPEFADYKGLCWKEYDPETDMTLAARGYTPKS